MPARDESFAAQTILTARRHAGLTQRALANRARLPASVLCAYELGRRQPSAATLARIVRMAGARLVLHDRADERLRQKVQLELAVGAASRLPRRDRGELTFPTFRELTGQ